MPPSANPPVVLHDPSADRSAVRETVHRGDDDLLSAGLGAIGLQHPQPPPCADPARPDAAEQRRRAIWSNWRGIAFLPTALADGLPQVPGREFHALARLAGATHPHRLMVQLPDAVDLDARCLVVTAASGSRGIYGAQAVAAHWALPRGLPVASTDKGAGCDWFDAAGGIGFDIAGRPTDDPSRMVFAPTTSAGDTPRIAIAHAHSGDNPEADWGRHLRQAAEFGLRMLDRAFPQQAPFRFDNTRVIAVGLSNAGAAVLRAAADPQPWVSAAVAAAPNVFAPDGGRALFDHATEAALWMPAALLSEALDGLPSVAPLLPEALVERQRAAHADALQRRGLLPRGAIGAAAAIALQRLRDGGWSDRALRAANLSSALGMWRAVGCSYASAYGRFGVDAHPLGVRFAMLDEAGCPRAPSAAERADWWSLGAGIVPGEGVEIVAPAQSDPIEALRALRGFVDGDDAVARRVQAGLAATRAAPPRRDLPLWLLHGVDDGLIPERFSSAAYRRVARAAGARVGYWRLHDVQHFDAMLGLPAFAGRYRPLLPWLHAALDEALAHLLHGAPDPVDRTVAAAG